MDCLLTESTANGQHLASRSLEVVAQLAGLRGLVERQVAMVLVIVSLELSGVDRVVQEAFVQMLGVSLFVATAG